ncbi:hypothetical protein [Thermus sp.]|uniref:hypothetical protein n=1 Tax=Thermus sp. TaxID=275 RepID=UPI00321FF8CE
MRERLLSEIWYWEAQALQEEVRAREEKAGAKARAGRARRRAEELKESLRRREEELLKARRLRPLPPRLAHRRLGVKGRRSPPSSAPSLPLQVGPSQPEPLQVHRRL